MARFGIAAARGLVIVVYNCFARIGLENIMAKLPRDASPQPTARESLSSSGSREAISNEEVLRLYTQNSDKYKSLCDEISFSLTTAVNAEGIRISDISTRVKNVDSVLEKVSRKGYGSFDQITDLVGARIICLFRQDLERIKTLISGVFKIDSYDDKSYSDPDSFGYMSLHFQCRLKGGHTGPRYDAIKSISFELQLRTICMHAWSAVQHALDYKGEWDVPEQLKKDINALSAMFYVADTQFGAVYAAKIAEYEKEDAVGYEEKSDIEVNLDTLINYAKEKFPDREHSGSSHYSSLVNELIQSGYSTISSLNRDIDRAEKAFALDEKESGNFYNNIGAIRVSIGLASKSYRELVYKLGGGFTEEMLDLVE